MTTFKKVALRAPFVSLVEGLVVQGRIDRKRAEVHGKFGTKTVVVMVLTAPCVTSVKKGDKLVKHTYAVGEAIQLEVKPGLVAIMDLPEQAEVRVTVTGKVDTGKGNPAWTFDLEVAS